MTGRRCRWPGVVARRTDPPTSPFRWSGGAQDTSRCPPSSATVPRPAARPQWVVPGHVELFMVAGCLPVTIGGRPSLLGVAGRQLTRDAPGPTDRVDGHPLFDSRRGQGETRPL